jgi:hypothetical protein
MHLRDTPGPGRGCNHDRDRKKIIMNASIGIIPVDPEPADETDLRRFVYIASPLSTFQSPRYLRTLGRLGNRFPDSEFIISRDLSTKIGERRSSWPAILRQCAAICVIPDHEGWISYQVWYEMWDAVGEVVLVIVISDEGKITPLDRVIAREFSPGDRRRFARLDFRNGLLLMDGG